MPVYPIFEVNQGTNTVLRGGTYNTTTRQINPSGGTDSRNWDTDIRSDRNLIVVYETPGGNQSATLATFDIGLNGTQVVVTGR